MFSNGRANMSSTALSRTARSAKGGRILPKVRAISSAITDYFLSHWEHSARPFSENDAQARLVGQVRSSTERACSTAQRNAYHVIFLQKNSGILPLGRSAMIRS